MAETTKKATEEATPETENLDVTRFIDNEEEIWDPDETDEGGQKRGKMLTLDEQLGIVEFELSTPLQLSDRDEKIATIKVKGPSKSVMDTSNLASKIVEKCVLGINPRDLKNITGRDYLRLQKLLRHFLQ